MSTEEKVMLIKEAIEKAEQFQSKLTDEVRDVPFLGSLKIRALMNNLGELATRYMEIGCHKGGSYCSAVFKNENLKSTTVIDSFESDHMNGETAKKEFLINSARFTPVVTKINIIQKDCFAVDLSEVQSPIDLYLYDAGHSFDDQRIALIYYKPVLAETFIYCCDDWAYERVKEGTLAGIKEGGYEVLFEKELLNTTQGDDLHLNDEWWRGYYVALLKKK